MKSTREFSLLSSTSELSKQVANGMSVVVGDDGGGGGIRFCFEIPSELKEMKLIALGRISVKS